MQTMILEAGCGWLPSMFERFEEHHEMFGRIKAPEWKTPPMEIFLRQMMVTVEACEEIDLKIALEFLPGRSRRARVRLAALRRHARPARGLPEGGGRGGHRRRADAQMLATGTLERWFPAQLSAPHDLRAGRKRRGGAGRMRARLRRRGGSPTASSIGW